MIIFLLEKFWWSIPAAVLAFFIAWQHQKLTSLEKVIDSKNASIQAQNNVLQALKAQGLANVAQAKKDAQKRETKAAQVKIIYRDRVKAIESAAIPAPCEAANTWAANQAADLSKGWQ